MESNTMAKNHAWVFAKVAFAAVFGGVSAGLIHNGWYDFWYVVFIALAVAAFVYGVVYVAYPIVQPAATAVSPPVIHPDLRALEDDQEVEETAKPEQPPTSPVIIEDIRLYRLHNNQIVRLPETVSPKHFGIVREARRRGDLPVVNQNRLNSIGVSRFGVAPNAATMLGFLQGIGAVDDSGQWTAEGDKMFPPPSPINHNGRNLTA